MSLEDEGMMKMKMRYFVMKSEESYQVQLYFTW